MRKLLIILIITVTAVPAHAQADLRLFQKAATADSSAAAITASKTAAQSADTIADQIRALSSLYSVGKYSQVLDLSRQLNDLPKDQNSLRLKYTIAAYKDLECNREADSVAKLFLQRDPFYKVSEDTDPIPFQEVLDNYYTMPKFSIWFAVGQSFAVPVIDTVYVITDTMQINPDYKSKYSDIVQIGFEYHPWRCLSVSVAPAYTKYQYTRSSVRNARSSFHYEETDEIISLPIHIEAYWIRGNNSKWIPSIYLGASAKYIINSSYKAYLETTGERRYDAGNKSHDPDDKNRLNFAILGGARINYNISRITIFGDLGLGYDIKPFNDPGAAYSNNELAYNKMYIPDSFHIFEFSAMVGCKVNLSYNTIAKYGYGF